MKVKKKVKDTCNVARDPESEIQGVPSFEDYYIYIFKRHLGSVCIKHCSFKLLILKHDLQQRFLAFNPFNHTSLNLACFHQSATQGTRIDFFHVLLATTLLTSKFIIPNSRFNRMFFGRTKVCQNRYKVDVN